jgi:hypothetical protein
MKKNNFILIALFALLSYACSDAYIGQYPVESVAPDSVSAVTFDSLPGAVKIAYKLPSDKDLLYVRATYYLDNGKKMEATASAFTNQMLIDGYGNSDSLRTIILNAVDLNQNVSKAIIVKVKPKKSPIYDIMNSVEAGVDFGGIYLKWKNPLGAKVIVVVNTEDKAGKQLQANGGKIYSQAKDVVSNIRGYDTIPRNFYIQVQDRWGNVTKVDTLKQVKPIFEQLIPKSFHIKWNGDLTIPYNEYNGSYGVQMVWNNKFGSTAAGDCFSTKSGGGVSSSITYDLNSQANNSTGKGWVIPSRVLIHSRNGYGYSALGKYVRVWGSTSPDVSTTNTEGPNAWVLLSPPQGFLITPPSGATNLTATADDKAAIENKGFDLVFAPGTKPIRYVRIEMAEMWGGATNTSFTIAELTWYGKVIN